MRFDKFCKKSQMVVKHVLLLFLNEKETAKVAMVCEDTNQVIDSNKDRVDGPMDEHLLSVFKKKHNIGDLKMAEVETMIRKFDEVAPESNVIVKLILLKDIYVYSE